ncbi:hypothetical protein [Nocardia carnea]|uniref:hypothetical protein n=1 Tax=Nocardia carnea TaxID=37328 RepID=UPI002453FE83|nr:hypothetical protein [Nocardia carnea]
MAPWSAVTSAVSETVPAQSSAAVEHAEAGRVVPGGGMTTSSGAVGTERAVRAGAADAEPGDGLEIDAGVRVAPPVLGAVERPGPETGST